MEEWIRKELERLYVMMCLDADGFRVWHDLEFGKPYESKVDGTYAACMVGIAKSVLELVLKEDKF